MEDPLTPAAEADILATPAAGRAAIRGGILRVAGYGLGVGLSVVGAALLIRHLGPTDFGRYTAVISLVTILAAISEAGLTSIGVREYSILPPGRREPFIRELTGLRLVTTAVGSVIAVAFATVANYDRDMIVGAAIVGLGMIVLGFQTSLAIPFQSQLRLGWITALELIRQSATVAVIALLVVGGASLIPFFWVPAVAALAALLVTAPVARRLVPLMPSFRRTDWRRLLALTVPFAAANAVGAIYVYLIVVVLSLISTEQQTGYFGASFRVFIVLSAVPGLLVSSAFPILARAARDDAHRLAYALQRLWEMMLVLGAGVALCTAVGAKLAIDVIAGDEFRPAVNVLEVQSLALLASFLVAIWGFALLSLSHYRELVVVNAVALAVSLTVSLTLGYRYGAEGAAWATVLGEVSLAVGCAVALLRRRPDLRFELGNVPRVIGAVALASAVLLLPIPREAKLVAVAAVYALAAWLFGAIPAEVGHALRPNRAE